MSNNSQNSLIQKNLSLKAFFSTFLRYWKFLLLIFIASFAISLTYTAFFTTPLYTSTAKLYIINKSSNYDQLTSADLNVSTYLTRDFVEILEDEVILSEVAEDLSNKYSASTIKRFINITPADNTRIIEVVVSSPSPKDSKQIADSICRISQEKLVEIMGLDRIKIIRNGNLPQFPSSPNVRQDAINSMILSLFLTIAIAFIILVSDNKISSCQDIEELLGLNILTTIPYTTHKNK